MLALSRSLTRNLLYFAACASWGCSEAKEAERVELDVVADGSALDELVSTDVGYDVELSSASMAVDDLKFTIAGEAHTAFVPWLSNLLVPEAHAHPGHFQGGEVTGELPGHFVLRFSPAKVHKIGTATLLVGSYHALDLTLTHAVGDDIKDGDPLKGHSATLTGTATKDGTKIEFDVVLDSPEGRDLVGIPFEEELTTATSGSLALRLSVLDPLEKDTLFDGVDFAALDVDGDGRVMIEPAASDAATVAAYNTIRRVFQTHDHFMVKARKK